MLDILVLVLAALCVASGFAAAGRAVRKRFPRFF